MVFFTQPAYRRGLLLRVFDRDRGEDLRYPGIAIPLLKLSCPSQ